MRSPPRSPGRLPFLRKNFKNLPPKLRARIAVAMMGEGATNTSSDDVPWPLAGNFGVNIEREYLYAGSEGPGVSLDLMRNVSRHARAVRFFPFSTNDLGHGSGSNPVFPADPFAFGNWTRALTAIDNAIAAGLKVIYCIIPGSPGDQDPLLMAPAVRQAYWRDVSRALAALYSPDELVLQPWNECTSTNASTVNALIAEAIEAIRRGAPEHWIAVSGPESGRIWQVANISLPAGTRRVAIDMHDYDTTRTGSATWYGKPSFVRQQIARLSQSVGYTVPVFFGEIDMARGTFTTDGYDVDDPLRVTELLTFRESLSAALIHPSISAKMLADIGGVATLMWAWNDNSGPGNRRVNDPASYEVSDWRPQLNAAFFPDVAPSFFAPPVISGTPRVNDVLTATPGGVVGTAPITIAFQWLRNGEPIPGATAGSYTLVTADLGTLITVRETATNGEGFAQSTSAAVGPVLAAAPPPDPEPPGDAPTAIVARFIGASHTAMFDSGTSGGATAEDGDRYVNILPVELRSITGRQVWVEQLQAAYPALPVTFARSTIASTGISAWADDSGITAACQTAITAWINAAAASPTAKALFVIFSTSRELAVNGTEPNVSTNSYALRHRLVVEAALAQFDAARPGQDREVWIVVAGNRWNTDNDSRGKIRRLANLTGVIVDAAEPAIPGCYGVFARHTMNLGDTNNTSDGIHFPTGQLQVIGAEMAYAMRERWGHATPTAPRIVNVWRTSAQAVRVRVDLGRGSGGDLLFGQGLSTTGLFSVFTGTSWALATVGAVDNTFKSDGFVEIPLTFSVNVPDVATFAFGLEKFVTIRRDGETLINYPHEVATGGAGITANWDHITAPRPVIRPLLPFFGPVALSAPPDP